MAGKQSDSDDISPLTGEALRASFARQGLMTTFGATLDSIAAGQVIISAPLTPAVSQQHGAGHAGITFALGDSAAGYAALTRMPEGSEVMTVEMKINLIAPAVGQRLIATGTVEKAGRRLTVVTARVEVEADGHRRVVALMQGTMIPV
jgi:uncharacterized protein (TIGR00369 family)